MGKINGIGAVKVADSAQGSFNGTVNFAINPSITGTNPDVPDTGTVLVNGQSNSSATLVVQDTSFVNLDLNSDGSFGSPIPWSTILQ